MRLVKVRTVMSLVALIIMMGGVCAQQYETPPVTRSAATILPAEVLSSRP